MFEIMKIISWGINGLSKNFATVRQFATEFEPDFICLQKVRCDKGREKYQIEGYNPLYTAKDYGGDSGVMTYAKKHEGLTTGSYIKDFPIYFEPLELLSRNGHLQILECKDFFLINTYVPYANRDIENAVEYRKVWDEHFIAKMASLSLKKPLIICGDMNVVHTQLDSASKFDKNAPCYWQWERDNFNRLIAAADLVDAYRLLHPDEQAATYFGQPRRGNMGDRIHYFLVSRVLQDQIAACDILYELECGQSAPISLVIKDLNIL